MVNFKSDRLDFSTLTPDMVGQSYPDSLNNPEINQFLETRHKEQNIESCKNYIEECNLDDSCQLFGVFLRSNGSHIGNVKIGYINWLYKTGQISLVIFDQSLSGQGFGFEIVHSATKYAFNELMLEKVEAGAYMANKASIRVFEKVGYKKEGQIRESIILYGDRADYALLGIIKGELME